MKPALTAPSFAGNRAERIAALAKKGRASSLTLEETSEMYRLAQRVSHNRRIPVDTLISRLGRFA